jgi:hypothetical protein
MWWDCNVKYLPGQDKPNTSVIAEISRYWIKAAPLRFAAPGRAWAGLRP